MLGTTEFDFSGDIKLRVPNGGASDAGSDTTAISGQLEGTVASGELSQADVSVTGDVNVFGFVFTSPASNPASLKYVRGASGTFYELSGKVTAPEFWDASVTMGTESQPGVKIENGQWSVDNLTVSLSNVELGAFEIQQFETIFRHQGTTLDFDFDLAVAFPQGWAVKADIDTVLDEQTKALKINDVSVKASGLMIPIGETGLVLTEIDASLQNLTKPSELIVTGDIGVVYGETVTIFSEKVNFFKATGGFTVDKDELILDATVYFGALTDSKDKTRGILGSAKGEVKLDWGNETYLVEASASMLDGIFQWDAKFEFDDSNEIIVSAKAEVAVPHGIPLIGGKELAELDFMLKYEEHDGKAEGFVAAWTRIDLVFDKVTVGIQYGFEDKKVRIIGSGTVKADERSADKPKKKEYVYSQPFIVPETGAQQATLSLGWDRTFPSGTDAKVTLEVVPEGMTPIAEQDFCTAADCTTSNVSIIQQQDLNSTPRQVHLGVVGSRTDSTQPLPVNPGDTYTLRATFESEHAPDAGSVDIHTIRRSQDGFAQLNLSGSRDGILVGDAVRVTGTGVDRYNGHHVIREVLSDDVVVIDLMFDRNASGGKLRDWKLPQFQATWHVTPPTIAVSLPDQSPTGSLQVDLESSAFEDFRAVAGIDVYVETFDPIYAIGDVSAGSDVIGNLSSLDGLRPGQIVLGAGIPAGTTITSVNTAQQSANLSQTANASASMTQLTILEMQGVKVASLDVSDATYGKLTTQVDVSSLLPIPYYVYAVINDQTNTPVVSTPLLDTGAFPLAQVFQPQFAIAGFVANQIGEPLSGWTVVAQSGSTMLQTTTSADGLYGFQPADFPNEGSVSVGVRMLDPAAYAFSDDLPNGQRTVDYMGSELAVDFQIDQRSSIPGRVVDDQDPEAGLSGWTVFLDHNDNGVLDPGEQSTVTTHDGRYSLNGLDKGTYRVALALNNGGAALYTFDMDAVDGATVLDTAGDAQMVQRAGTLQNGASVDTATAFDIVDRPNADASNQVLRLIGNLSPGSPIELAPQFVNVPPSSDLSPQLGAFSAAAWIRADAAPNIQSIAGALETGTTSGGWDFRLRSAANYVSGPTLGGLNEPNGAASADFNGDDRLDLAFANGGGQNAVVMLNTTPDAATSPSFSAAALFDAGESSSSIAVADFNGDVKPDVAVAGGAESGGTASVLLNTTAVGAMNPEFAAQLAFPVGDEPTSIAVGDFNLDWKPDLVVANARSNTVSVLLNTTTAGATSAQFTAQHEFSVGELPISVAVNDINGDGRPDLVVANVDGQSLSVLINDTPGDAPTPSFQAQHVVNVNATTGDVVAEDFNLDGKPDLAVTEILNESVTLFLNMTAEGATTPSFGGGQFFTVEEFPSAISVGDFNDDGAPDLAVSNNSSSSVSVLLNNTSPGAAEFDFAGQRAFAAGQSPGPIDNGDFNGDGLADLVVVDRSFDNAIVLVNQVGSVVEVELAQNATVGAGALTLQSTEVLDRNVWHHVAFAYDPTADNLDDGEGAGTLTLFVDGVAVASSANRGTLPSSPDISSPSSVSFNIGDQGGSDAVNSFSGYLDDVSLWNAALSPIQIQALFNGGVTPSYFQTMPTGPDVYEVMIDGSGFDLATGNDFTVSEFSVISGLQRGNSLAKNGLLSDAVRPLQDWGVNLVDIHGNTTRSTTSDASGNYLLAEVAPGQYTVQIEIPEGWRMTSPLSSIQPTALGAGELAIGQEFAFAEIATGQLNGTIVDDATGAGTFDLDDIGRAGATIYLDVDRSGDLTDADVSAESVENGAYVLPVANVPDGTYRMRLLQTPGRLPTGPAAGFFEVTVDSGFISGEAELKNFFTAANQPPLIFGLHTRSSAEGELFSFDASFVDTDGVDSTHSATVDWGDGATSLANVEQLLGAGTVWDEHVYTQGGFYTATLRVVDDNDATVVVERQFTAIVTGAGVLDGVLQIVGEDDDDQLAIVFQGDGRVRLKASFLSQRRVFDVDGIDEIDVSLFSGSDRLRIVGNSQVPIVIDGELVESISANRPDFDRNGFVDGSDFLRWQRGFNESNATKRDGDADRDRDVDGDDLRAWEDQFGTETTRGVGANAAPNLEPTFLLVADRTRLNSVTTLRQETIDEALAEIDSKFSRYAPGTRRFFANALVNAAEQEPAHEEGDEQQWDADLDFALFEHFE